MTINENLTEVLNKVGIEYEVTGYTYDYNEGYYHNDIDNALITRLDRGEILDKLESDIMNLGYEVIYNKEGDDYAISLVNLDLIDKDDPFNLGKEYYEAESMLDIYNTIYKASDRLDLHDDKYTIY